MKLLLSLSLLSGLLCNTSHSQTNSHDSVSEKPFKNQWYDELYIGLGTARCNFDSHDFEVRPFNPSLNFGALLSRRSFLEFGLSPFRHRHNRLAFSPIFKYGIVLNKFNTRGFTLILGTTVARRPARNISNYYVPITREYSNPLWFVGLGPTLQFNVSERFGLLLDTRLYTTQFYFIGSSFGLDYSGEISGTLTYSIIHGNRNRWQENPEKYSFQIAKDKHFRKTIANRHSLMAQALSGTTFGARYEFGLTTDRKINPYIAVSVGYGAQGGLGAAMMLRKPGNYLDMSFNAGSYAFEAIAALSLDVMYKKLWTGGAFIKAGVSTVLINDPYNHLFLPLPSIALGIQYPKLKKQP